MKTIKLTKGYSAIVDEEDFSIATQFQWCANAKKNGVYAVCNTGTQIPDLYLHRFLMVVHGHDVTLLTVDHRNRNTLDCRKDNLRMATRSEQQHNQGIRSDNSTGVKGVYVHSVTKRFIAQFTNRGKVYYGGIFKTLSAASVARNKLVEAAK